MHFHLFAPPPIPIMPITVTAALAFAAGIALARRGNLSAIRALGGRIGEITYLRRASQQSEGSAARSRGNSAFEEYRRATLDKLEAEAREFRTFLVGLRHAADAADFEAFLKSRRERGVAP